MKTIQETMPNLNINRKGKSNHIRPQLDVFMAERQLNQKEFAAILGVDAATVSNWLTSNALPKLLTKEKLCREFKLSDVAFWKLFAPGEQAEQTK